MKNAVFGMFRRVALVSTDVSSELIASIISVTRIGELGAALEVTSNRGTLMLSQIADSCHPDDGGDTFL
jgi:hypothetical protein